MIVFLSKPEVAVLISLIGLILAIYGSIASFFSIKSYYQQKKFSRANDELIQRASIDWEGRFTSEEIERLNKELKSLGKQVDYEIPQKAREAFLKYRIESIAEELSRLYKEYITIKSQISDDSKVNMLDANVSKYIAEEVQSNFRVRNQNIGIVIILILLLFLSLPFGGDIVYTILRNIIYISGANMNLSHLTSYLMVLVIISYALYVIKINKIRYIAVYNKRKSIFLVLLFSIIWIISVYVISFDIFFKTFSLQAFVGIIGIIFFSLSIKIMVYMLSSR